MPLPTAGAVLTEATVYAKVTRRLIPLLFVCYVVAYLDRVNVGFAKLQMVGDLKFSDAVYGFGAGIFFIGYFVFEVPSNLALERIGARVWIARIMITWSLVSGAFAFVEQIPWGPLPALFGVPRVEFSFYALRMLLGLAEAGFFPGIILYLTYWYPSARRARAVALFMTALAAANVFGGPLSGAIMQYADGLHGWAGWRWLFVLEAVPSMLVGVLVLAWLPDTPQNAAWLTESERDVVHQAVAADYAGTRVVATAQRVREAMKDGRLWALAFVYLTFALGLYGVNFWMPTIIQELGINKTDYLRVGLISAIPWGMAGITMVLYGSHSDRTGERRWHVAAALLVAAGGLLGLAFSGHAIVPSVISLTLVACGLLGSASAFWSLPTGFLQQSAAAAGIAWINSVGNLGGHFGPDMIGRIRESTGSASAAFLTLAGFVASGAIVTLLATRPTGPVRAPSNANAS
jgi:D-galactonate transporter